MTDIDENSKEYPLQPINDFNGLGEMTIAKQEIGTSIFKSLLGIIPFYGPMIYDGLVDYHRRVSQKRLNLFIVKLKEYFETVSKEEIDTEFLKSEDFTRLFKQVIEKVGDTKSEKKIEIFRDILVANINAKKVSDFSETFLNMISQLHEKQIEILKKYQRVDRQHYNERNELQKRELEQQNLKILLSNELVNKQSGLANNASKFEEEVEELNNIIESLQDNVNKVTLEKAILKHNFFDIPESIYLFYLQDLVSKALLMDMSSGYIGSANNPFSEICITEFGKHLLDFIWRENQVV